MRTFLQILSLLPGLFFLTFAIPRLSDNMAYNFGMFIGGLIWFIPAYFAFRKRKPKKNENEE